MTGVSLLRSDEGALASRPLDPFAVHTPMLWGFIFLCYIEHLTRTAGSPDKHADTVCSRHQLNRAEGSREELPCGVKGQRPLGSPNQHAGTLCSCAQPNREKGVERVEDPSRVQGRALPESRGRASAPPLYTKNSYFPCKSTKFEPEFRLNSGGFFFECVLYYMNEGSVRCKTDRNQTPPFRNDDAGEVGIVE